MANDQIRTDEEARASIAFADAALNLAGHVVTDAHLRDLQWKMATESSRSTKQVVREKGTCTRSSGIRMSEDPSWDEYFIPGTQVLRNKFTGGGELPYGG